MHDTRLCNQLLEPKTNDDIWHQDESSSQAKPSATRSRSNDGHPYYSNHSHQEQESYLEAALKLQPGVFECKQVWETHFPLHPRLKTGPGKLGTSKGVFQLRFVLNAFSVTNRSNMFVYQEDSGNVFYLRLHESSCISHKNASGLINNLNSIFSSIALFNSIWKIHFQIPCLYRGTIRTRLTAWP